jgi:hypothetical protein
MTLQVVLETPDRGFHFGNQRTVMKRSFSDAQLPGDAANVQPRLRRGARNVEREEQVVVANLRDGGRLASIGAMVLALLATQHHTIMMLLLAFGLSDAAMSFMTAAPIVRDVMLGMSFAMIFVIAWQIRNTRRHRSMRVLGAISIVVTLGLLVWSISRFGV